MGWQLSGVHNFMVTEVDHYGWVQSLEAIGPQCALVALKGRELAALSSEVLEYLKVWQPGMFGMRSSGWPPALELPEGATAKTVVSASRKQREMEAKLKEQAQLISELQSKVKELQKSTRKTRSKTGKK